MSHRKSIRCFVLAALATAFLPLLHACWISSAEAQTCRATCAAACRQHLRTCILGPGHVGRHYCGRGCAWF